MAKTPDSKLFLLIQSLTKAEKSYFRKQSRTFASDVAYGQLFDLMVQQKKYDEQEVIRLLKAPVSQFAVLKNYLYEAVLDSLIQYRSDKNEEQKLVHLKQKALVLVDKKLYEPALKILAKAIHHAEEAEYFTIAIDLISIEYKLYANWKPIDLNVSKRSWQRMEHCIELLRNQHQYQQLNVEFIYWQRKERTLRNQEVLNELERVMQHPLLQNIHQAQSFLAKLLFLTTHDGYCKIQGNYTQATDYTRQMLELYEQTPQLQIRSPQNFLVAYVNHLNNCYYIKHQEALLEGLQKLQKMHFEDSKLENIRFSRYATLYLSYIKLSSKFEDLNLLMYEINRYINESRSPIQVNEKRLLYYNATELYIKQKNYKTASDVCLLLNSLPITDTQNDLQRFGRLFEMLIHYELDNLLLVESLCQNARRRLSQKHELYEYESLFIALFYRLSTIPSSEIKETLKNYYNLFEQLPEKQKAMEYFDIFAWLQS